MKVKEEADHALNVDAENSVNKEEQSELQEDDHEDSAAAEKVKQLIDDLEMNVLGEEITSYWADPEFLKLVEDPKFLKKFDGVCGKLFSRFQLPPTYSCEDFKQEVIAQFAKTLSQFRSEANLNTWLYAIAHNWLVNISRKLRQPCVSFESLNLEGTNGEERVTGELDDSYGKTNRNRVAEIEDCKVLINELMNKLSSRERFCFIEYHLEGRTTEEIGEILGISRQAVSKQLERVNKKLRSYVDQQISPGGHPVMAGTESLHPILAHRAQAFRSRP